MYDPDDFFYSSSHSIGKDAHKVSRQLIIERLLRKSGCLDRPKQFIHKPTPVRNLPSIQIKSYQIETDCPLKAKIDNDIRENAQGLGIRDLLRYRHAEAIPLPLLKVIGSRPACLNTNIKSVNSSTGKKAKKKRSKKGALWCSDEDEEHHRLRAVKEQQFHHWEENPCQFMDAPYEFPEIKKKKGTGPPMRVPGGVNVVNEERTTGYRNYEVLTTAHGQSSKLQQKRSFWSGLVPPAPLGPRPTAGLQRDSRLPPLHHLHKSNYFGSDVKEEDCNSKASVVRKNNSQPKSKKIMYGNLSIQEFDIKPWDY